jgi:hypothetical protein
MPHRTSCSQLLWLAKWKATPNSAPPISTYAKNCTYGFSEPGNFSNHEARLTACDSTR